MAPAVMPGPFLADQGDAVLSYPIAGSRIDLIAARYASNAATA
jgi:hypothetical protein